MTYLLEIQTVQATTFKQVIDSLKEILMDVNLEFDEAGMRIMALDNSKLVMVHLRLDASRFEHFYSARKLYVGVNMLKLYAIIKTIGSNDMLRLFIDADDPNHLGIRISNNEKGICTTYKLSMLDINVLDVKIPPADFETIITMPSVDFQKIIRDAHNLSDFIEIRNVGNQLHFACKGDFCTQESVLGAEKGEVQINNRSTKAHDIIQGVFSLKYLTMFTKCTNLSAIVEMYLKNSYPLVLKYDVATLGSIRLAVAQYDDSPV